MKMRLTGFIAACVLALSGAAHAQQFASTSKSVHLRAGPGRDFPVVAILGPRTAVNVYGCVPSYTWCDVESGPDRGWVYAGNLVYAYDNREVLLPSIAAVVGIGIAGFVLEDYWHDHYLDRWWWPVRRRWYRPPHVPPLRGHPPVRVPHPPRPPGAGVHPPPGAGVHPPPRGPVAPHPPSGRPAPRGAGPDGRR